MLGIDIVNYFLWWLFDVKGKYLCKAKNHRKFLLNFGILIEKWTNFNTEQYIKFIKLNLHNWVVSYLKTTFKWWDAKEITNKIISRIDDYKFISNK